MKLALALGSLVLVPWSSVRPQEPSAPGALARARVLDARTLEVVRSDAAGERRSELTLADLPPGTRLHAALATPYQESGLAVGLVLAVGEGFEYRYLCRREGDTHGARAVVGPPQDNDGWWLSQPLFAEVGAPYRIVEVHNPGSDTLELTFRRGVPSVKHEVARLDEIVVVDDCPGYFPGSLEGKVHRIQASGRPL